MYRKKYRLSSVFKKKGEKNNPNNLHPDNNGSKKKTIRRVLKCQRCSVLCDSLTNFLRFFHHWSILCHIWTQGSTSSVAPVLLWLLLLLWYFCLSFYSIGTNKQHSIKAPKTHHWTNGTYGVEQSRKENHLPRRHRQEREGPPGLLIDRKCMFPRMHAEVEQGFSWLCSKPVKEETLNHSGVLQHPLVLGKHVTWFSAHLGRHNAMCKMITGDYTRKLVFRRQFWSGWSNQHNGLSRLHWNN